MVTTNTEHLFYVWATKFVPGRLYSLAEVVHNVRSALSVHNVPCDAYKNFTAAKYAATVIGTIHHNSMFTPLEELDCQKHFGYSAWHVNGLHQIVELKVMVVYDSTNRLNELTVGYVNLIGNNVVVSHTLND